MKNLKILAVEAVVAIRPTLENLMKAWGQKDIYIVFLDPTKTPENSEFKEAILYEFAKWPPGEVEHLVEKALAEAEQVWKTGAGKSIALSSREPMASHAGYALHRTGIITACAGAPTTALNNMIAELVGSALHGLSMYEEAKSLAETHSKPSS